MEPDGASRARNMNAGEIASMVGRLAPVAAGTRIQRIDQPDPWSLAFDLRRDSRRVHLLVSADPRYSRVHLLSHRPRTPDNPSSLLQVVRAHATGARVEALEQVAGDRIVILRILQRDPLLNLQHYRLIAELTGLHANLLFVDPADRILGVLRAQSSARRKVRPGMTYEPPPPPPSVGERARPNRFADAAERGGLTALSRAVEDYFGTLILSDTWEQRRQQLLGTLARKRAWLAESVREKTAALANARDRESLRQRGELLKTLTHEIQRGQTAVRTTNFYDPEQPEIVIALDPLLRPQQNVEEYFKRYKKLKAAEEQLRARLADAHALAVKVDDLIDALSAEPSRDALDLVEAEMKALGLLSDAAPAGSRIETAQGPRQFTSGDGFEILVARNQRENETLTFRIARGNDLWLHVSDWPGPHVIIRRNRGQEIPYGTLLDAAHLAIFFSKIRGATVADVVYTERKYVQKPRGAKTGTVYCASAKRLAVRRDEARLERLLGKGKGKWRDG